MDSDVELGCCVEGNIKKLEQRPQSSLQRGSTSEVSFDGEVNPGAATQTQEDSSAATQTQEDSTAGIKKRPASVLGDVGSRGCGRAQCQRRGRGRGRAGRHGLYQDVGEHNDLAAGSHAEDGPLSFDDVSAVLPNVCGMQRQRRIH